MQKFRTFGVASLAPLLVANGDPGTSLDEPQRPAQDTSLQQPSDSLILETAEQNCSDTFETVYGNRGEMLLRRENASPANLSPILAVDYNVEGCSFMVSSDQQVQPVPASPAENAPLFRRLQ